MRTILLAFTVWLVACPVSVSAQMPEFRVKGNEKLQWTQLDPRPPDLCRVKLAIKPVAVIVTHTCIGSPLVCTAPIAPIDVAILPPSGTQATLECANRLAVGGETEPGVSAPFVLLPPTPPAAPTGVGIIP